MPITYTNRKGFTYYLCQGQTKTGKPRYFFAREVKGDPVEEIPDGYEIRESVNGIVSLAKARPSQILPEEVEAVEAAIQKHPKPNNYRVSVKPDRIDIYERVGPDADDLLSALGGIDGGIPDLADRLRAGAERHGRFTPVLRFIFYDPAVEQRSFGVQRMCYLGSVDDWIDIGETGTAAELAHRLIPKLGTDEFFNLH